ncbi:YhcH/YjgK/YiaL family protein [Patescibacteria group bacterium]|nr:YhcH/YjgK/YiaL family protein [Patescibacteria group bacterium]
MIFDTINNLSKYKSIPNLDLIVDFIKDKNLLDLSESEIEIKGRNLFVKALRYFPKLAEERNFETHKIYTDVQIIVKGVEKIQITNKENLKEEIEDKKDREDFQLFTASGDISEIIAKESNFVVFFPGEPHKPSCVYQKLDKPIMKLIFKTTP